MHGGTCDPYSDLPPLVALLAYQSTRPPINLAPPTLWVEKGISSSLPLVAKWGVLLATPFVKPSIFTRDVFSGDPRLSPWRHIRRRWAPLLQLDPGPRRKQTNSHKQPAR